MEQEFTAIKGTLPGVVREQRPAEEPDLTLRVLGTLNVFRLLVAVMLLGLFFASGDPRFFGDRYPALFSATAAGYFVFSVVSGLAIRQRWVSAGLQALAQLTADIAAIVILMHASGGITSGLGGLLVVFLGAGSLVLPLQAPLIFAALAALALLGEQFFSQLGGVSDAGNYPAAGILGAIGALGIGLTRIASASKAITVRGPQAPSCSIRPRSAAPSSSISVKPVRQRMK